MFAFMVISMTLIVFACGLMWLMSSSLRDWSERPKFKMLEREQRYEKAKRHAPE